MLKIEEFQDSSRCCRYLVNENRMCSYESRTRQVLQLPSSTRLKRWANQHFAQEVRDKDILTPVESPWVCLRDVRDITMRMNIFARTIGLFTLPPYTQFARAYHVLQRKPVEQGIRIHNTLGETISSLIKGDVPATLVPVKVFVQNTISSSLNFIVQPKYHPRGLPVDRLKSR